ncbi:MAG TPA: GNAT family N-acetyltransferase [Myxococcales bacterium]|jgi:phosphinothricin acetyltransferase
MLIRPSVAADFDAIAALTNPYILETAIHFGTAEVTGDELRADWEKGRDRYAFLVAESDGEIAGYAKTSAFRTRAAYQWTAETGIYVSRARHHQGLGSALYTRLIEVSRAQGFHSLVGGITLPNPASVGLHEKLGFVPAARFPQSGFKLGRWHDVGFWVLVLAPADQPPKPLRTLAEVW